MGKLSSLLFKILFLIQEKPLAHKTEAFKVINFALSTQNVSTQKRSIILVLMSVSYACLKLNSWYYHGNTPIIPYNVRWYINQYICIGRLEQLISLRVIIANESSSQDRNSNWIRFKVMISLEKIKQTPNFVLAFCVNQPGREIRDVTERFSMDALAMFLKTYQVVIFRLALIPISV